MPSLGIFKKKRTKDSSTDSPTSPTKDSQSATSPNQKSPFDPATSNPPIDNVNNNNNFNIQSTYNDPSSFAPQQPSSSAAISPSTAPMNPATALSSQPNAPTIQSLLNQTPEQPSPSPSQNLNTAPPPQSGQQQQSQQQQSQQPRETKGKYALNDFMIQRTLGTGSFGRVHLVQSRHNQRYYAIKVLKKAQVVKMKQVEHTNDERRMLQRVKHPFLITLWGTFQDSKNLYMVMDFIEGGELFSLLRKSQVRPRLFDDSVILC
jgi:protein kinase A